MKYWKQGFYDEPVEGGVEITDERWLELIDGQAAGMLITEDEQGSPVLTEYVNSVPVPTYEQRVQQSIRERYSVDDELAILRQRDTKPDGFAAYYEYAEQCKAQAKKQRQILLEEYNTRNRRQRRSKRPIPYYSMARSSTNQTRVVIRSGTE